MAGKRRFSNMIWTAIQAQFLEGYSISTIADGYGINPRTLAAKISKEQWPRPPKRINDGGLPPLVVYKEERQDQKIMVFPSKTERVLVENSNDPAHMLPTPYANMEKKFVQFPPLPDNPLYTSTERINKMTREELAIYSLGCEERSIAYHKSAMETTNRIHKTAVEIIERAKTGDMVEMERVDAAYRAIRALGLDKIPFAKAQGPQAAVQINNTTAGQVAEGSKVKRIAVPL